MALVLADRVQETSTTSGTGAFTLNGAVSGYQSFATGIGSGNTVYYAIYDATAFAWETGLGTFTSPSTLTRTTVFANSLGTTAFVSFAGNTTSVFATYPGSKAVSTDTLATPPAIGGTTPAAGAFTTLSATTPIAFTSGGTAATTAPAAQANLLGYTTIATAAGTTTLDNTSSFYQIFTGATTQTVVLPVTSTLQTGWSFRINNNSTGALSVQSSGLNAVITVVAGATVMCTCIDTTVTTAAGWRVGTTEITAVTGTGSMVLSSNPSIIAPTITSTLSFTGGAGNSSNFHTTQTNGVMTIGGTAGTGLITFGRSTVSQQTDFQAGITSTGNTKTINFGTGGASGSTTNIAIGSATAGATSTTTVNGAFNYANKAVTVTSNAGTVPVSAKLNTFTNSPAATMAITMAVTGAVDGQMTMVRIYDFSAATQTIGWTNTENSTVSVPLISNGSTTLPLTVGFMYNSQTSRWRCIASA
jgi:hypothetical protein